MNLAVKIFESFAAMADHRTGKGGQRFFRNFDRAGNEKLVVWNHGANVQRSTLQRPTFECADAERDVRR